MDHPAASNDAKRSGAPRENWLLALIGGVRLVEGALVLVVAVGALRLLHQDVAAKVADWVAAVRIDPHNTYLHALLAKIGLLNDERLKEISAGSFIYGGLKLVEGVGLLRGKRWAEYLTIVAISVMIPVEVHELVRNATPPKAVLLVVNVAVVVYLVINLRRTRGQPDTHASAAQPASPTVD